MQISKQTQVREGEGVSAESLRKINALARKTLQADQVYTFGVRLCDNEVDRDGERFSEATLRELAKLFVGKSGVFDHQWSARGQAARIYQTEVVQEEESRTQAGDPYCYLKGWAYMLRTEGNRDLIAEIEGGIKKEVSVGCAVEKVVCSICGQELGQCGHEKGKQYHGKLCFGELTGATDAYEWSFVAVPAQKNAGVMKRMGWERQKQLEQEAELGRRYLAGLRREVARLGGLTEGGLEAPALERIAARLEEPELLELKQVFEARLRRRWPIESQLNDTGETKRETARDGAFII